MSQDKESNERVLELEAKHHLHGKSDQEVGDLMQSMPDGELVALLKDFKVPYHHKRKRLKACEMIEEFKKHREDGYPRLKRSLMTDAQRTAAARKKETRDQKSNRQQKDATAKDATALRIEKKVSVQFDDRLSALDSKYGFQGKSNVEVDSKLRSMPKGKLVALLNSIKVPCHPYYQRLTVDGMIDVFKKQREGKYPLLWNDLMDEAKDASYRYYAKKQKIFGDATRRAASVKYENKEARKKLLQSLIGLKLNVPEHWWQGRRGIKKWKCVVESVDSDDIDGRYVIIKCTEDDAFPEDRYGMSYEAVKEYADVEQDNFSSFDLPDVEL